MNVFSCGQSGTLTNWATPPSETKPQIVLHSIRIASTQLFRIFNFPDSLGLCVVMIYP